MPIIENGFIGFEPPLIGHQPVKLETIFEKGEWIAIEKPQELSIRPISEPENTSPINIENAIQAKIREARPSLDRSGFRPDYRPKSIFSIDAEMHGFGLWALNDKKLEAFRNDYGSGYFLFEYEFLARDHTNSGEEFSVNLPIARHLQDPRRYVVSTSTGKKSETTFLKIKQWPKAQVALRTATTRRARGHQIRLHAQECGLTILGESLYGADKGISLLDLKKRHISKRDHASTPLWSGLNARMGFLKSRHAGEFEIRFPRPPSMKTLIRKLDQFS